MASDHHTAGSVLFGSTTSWETSDLYPLFPVETVKFGIMTVCTLGFYKYYWFYKSWKRIADSTGEDISPFWRTVFVGLWSFSLFSRVESMCQGRDIPVKWSSVWLGIPFLLLSATWRLPAPYSLLIYLNVLPVLPVVLSAERLNATYRDKVTESPNESFSGLNIAGIAIGCILLLLVVVGSFLPAKP